MMKLDNTIKVIVPTVDNNGKAIDYMPMVQKVTDYIGGSTMYDAQGLWVAGGKLYNDKNKMVEFNTDDSHVYNSVTEVMVYLVGPLLHEGGQLAVWLQVNGATLIINEVNAEALDEVTSILSKVVL